MRPLAGSTKSFILSARFPCICLASSTSALRVSQNLSSGLGANPWRCDGVVAFASYTHVEAVCPPRRLASVTLIVLGVGAFSKQVLEAVPSSSFGFVLDCFIVSPQAVFDAFWNFESFRRRRHISTSITSNFSSSAWLACHASCLPCARSLDRASSPPLNYGRRLGSRPIKHVLQVRVMLVYNP